MKRQRGLPFRLLVLLVPAVILTGCVGSGGGGGTPPSAPGTPVVTAGDRQLTVQWSPVNGATSYEIWKNIADDPATASLVAEAMDTSHVITGLENGTTYYVWLKAKNNAGTSGFSPAGKGIPGFLFGDDFESYTVGPWTGGGSWIAGEDSDPWSIVQEGGTKILKSALGNSGQLYVDNDDWTDCTVSARVRLDDTAGSFYLYGRSSSSNLTMYMFQLQNYVSETGKIDCYLRKRIKEGEAWYEYPLGTFDHPFAINIFHTIKMVLASGNIRCYIDATKIFDYTDVEGDGDGAPLLFGGIGLDSMNGGYSCDEVLVTK